MPVIEVFADVRCPFTHVALRRLVERRPSAADFSLRVRAWPLELVSWEPLSGELIAEEVAACGSRSPTGTRGACRPTGVGRSVQAHARLMRKGARLQAPKEDTLQLGGDFVVGRDGNMLYAYRSKGSDDRPPTPAPASRPARRRSTCSGWRGTISSPR